MKKLSLLFLLFIFTSLPAYSQDKFNNPAEHTYTQNSIDAVMIPGISMVMYIKDSEGNQIQGPLEDGGTEIVKFNHKVLIPYEEETNKLIGTRKITAVEATKFVDRLTPRLYEFLCDGKQFKEVKFSFYRIAAETGTEELYFEFTLQDARIVTDETKKSDEGDLEFIEFLAREYTWEYLEGGFTYQESFPKLKAPLHINSLRGELKLWDESGNQIQGPREDHSSLIWNFSHKVYIPYDPENHNIQGNRRIMAFELTKPLDKVQPQLMQALCNANSWTKAEIYLYTIAENTGEEVAYFTYTLENIKIVMDSIAFSKNDIGVTDPYRETISILAQKFTWTNLLTGESYSEQTYTNVQWDALFGEYDLPSNEIAIENNYPNPFNSSTCINFAIPVKYINENLTVFIYDIVGRLVKKLYYGPVSQTHMSITWDGTNTYNNVVSSGNYFYQIVTGNLSKTGKMTYLK